jgi:hypothetical protein
MMEELPAHRIYTAKTDSGGRWQMLSLPSPLYRIEVRARVKLWDYDDNRFVIEDIPIPAGCTFSCKLIFVSKNDIEMKEHERPDKMHS